MHEQTDSLSCVEMDEAYLVLKRLQMLLGNHDVSFKNGNNRLVVSGRS